MGTVAIITGAVEVVAAASRAIELANRAIEAANNGDEGKAEQYLAESRERFSAAKAEWDAAGG